MHTTKHQPDLPESHNIVHCYRRQITDRLATEYAATRAKGHD